MPVPSSGQLRLRADINQEVNGNNTDTNVSLGTLSNDVGFTEPDNMSDFYGYTACVAPSVTTNTSTNVGSGSLRAQGNLTSLGGAGCTVTDHGFYVGTSTNYASNTKYSLGAAGGTGAFSYNVTGLSASTTYRVFAYATNSVGTTIGNMVTTTTTLPGISIYIGGYFPNNNLTDLSACCSSTGVVSSASLGISYGNCYSCPVTSNIKLTGSGCQCSTSYPTFTTCPTDSRTNSAFTGTFWHYPGYYDVQCTTCSPTWYGWLTKSGHTDYVLGNVATASCY